MGGKDRIGEYTVYIGNDGKQTNDEIAGSKYSVLLGFKNKTKIKAESDNTKLFKSKLQSLLLTEKFGIKSKDDINKDKKRWNKQVPKF